jgi:hypothetical protein
VPELYPTVNVSIFGYTPRASDKSVKFFDAALRRLGSLAELLFRVNEEPRTPMNRLAMALLFPSSIDYEARWKPRPARLMPELEVQIWPVIGDPAEIDYALVWRPEPGLLASLPNLKLILSECRLSNRREPRHQRP